MLIQVTIAMIGMPVTPWLRIAAFSSSVSRAVSLPCLHRDFASTSAYRQDARSKPERKGPTPAQARAQWDFLLGTMNPNRPSESTSGRASDLSFVSPVYNHLDGRKKLTREQQMEAFESAWRDSHSVPSPHKPAKPSEGRTIAFDRNAIDLSSAYNLLQSVLRRNNVRSELALGDRYEKPNQRRRRLASLRHRRRFADLVRQKVQLVSS